MTDLLIAIPVALLLVISGILTLVGSLGLLRLRSFFRRIHAPTLGNTLGIFGVLVATIILASVNEERLVIHPILITLFLFITSPVTAMLLMRAAIRRRAETLAMPVRDVLAQGPSNQPDTEIPSTDDDVPRPEPSQ